MIIAPAVLLRLAHHRHRLRDHGDRRHGSDRILAVDAAADQRVPLGSWAYGWSFLVRLSRVCGAEPNRRPRDGCPRPAHRDPAHPAVHTHSRPTRSDTAPRCPEALEVSTGCAQLVDDTAYFWIVGIAGHGSSELGDDTVCAGWPIPYQRSSFGSEEDVPQMISLAVSVKPACE